MPVYRIKNRLNRSITFQDTTITAFNTKDFESVYDKVTLNYLVNNGSVSYKIISISKIIKPIIQKVEDFIQDVPVVINAKQAKRRTKDTTTDNVEVSSMEGET